MLPIRVSTNFPDWPLARQTPASSGTWDGKQFTLRGGTGAYHAWVVYEGLTDPEEEHCSPANTIFIAGEPPGIRRYNPRFLAQFATVVTCQPIKGDFRVIRTQQAQPWHIGVQRRAGEPPLARYAYDDFRTWHAPSKERLASLICSDKRHTHAHRRRLRFLEKLQRRLGSMIDIWGRGFRPLEDKWDGIAPYKYHIILENSAQADYWTEKLADSYLGRAYPIYYGCPNLSEYFSPEAFTPIDIDNAGAAIDTIERTITSDLFQARRPAIEVAAQQVLTKFNLFAVLSALCERLPSRRPARLLLYPEAHFNRRLAPRHLLKWIDRLTPDWIR